MYSSKVFILKCASVYIIIHFLPPPPPPPPCTDILSNLLCMCLTDGFISLHLFFFFFTDFYKFQIIK